MKVEKINENKIKITLTFEELEKRDISLKDIEKNTLIAKNLFIDLIEESNIDEDFKLEDSQLFIEAASDNNNLFIVTITKVDSIPELKKYSLFEENIKRSDRNTKNKSFTNSNISYKVRSNLYAFDSIDKILDMCSLTKNDKIFFGKNSLYKHENTYFLVFSQSSIKNKKFLKTFIFLSEFCSNYYSQDIFTTGIIEKSKLIIENSALQKLSKI